MKIFLFFITSLAYSQCNSLSGSLTTTGSSAQVQNTVPLCANWAVAITTTPPVFSYTANLQGNFGSGFVNIGNTCSTIGSCNITYSGTIPNQVQLNVSTFSSAVQGLINYNITGAVPSPFSASNTAGALTQISKQVLTSPQASITFSGIPQNFNNLLLTLDAASSSAVVLDNSAIQFNGDSGTNYNFQLILMSAAGSSVFNTATVAGSANTGCVALVGASAPAGKSSHTTISILNYAGTTFQKNATCTWGSNGADASSSANNNLGLDYITWKNTAAITSIRLNIVSGGNFVTGSTAILYGVN